MDVPAGESILILLIQFFHVLHSFGLRTVLFLVASMSVRRMKAGACEYQCETFLRTRSGLHMGSLLVINSVDHV